MSNRRFATQDLVIELNRGVITDIRNHIDSIGDAYDSVTSYRIKKNEDMLRKAPANFKKVFIDTVLFGLLVPGVVSKLLVPIANNTFKRLSLSNLFYEIFDNEEESNKLQEALEGAEIKIMIASINEALKKRNIPMYQNFTSEDIYEQIIDLKSNLMSILRAIQRKEEEKHDKWLIRQRNLNLTSQDRGIDENIEIDKLIMISDEAIREYKNFDYKIKLYQRLRYEFMFLSMIGVSEGHPPTQKRFISGKDNDPNRIFSFDEKKSKNVFTKYLEFRYGEFGFQKIESIYDLFTYNKDYDSLKIGSSNNRYHNCEKTMSTVVKNLGRPLLESGF